jgi:chorismate dehydratase
MIIRQDNRMTTLGVVSFLNARPLIEGLDATRGVSLHYAVPSALPSLLRGGQVDAALIPVIDLARGTDAWQRISDACIGCDGETLTVRIFSRTPPEYMTTLYVDEDSHTSIALAQLIWLHRYERRLAFIPNSAAADLNDCEAVLLIGDKVVNAPLEGFEYEIDLGAEWKEWTGLPFVFAVWAAPAGEHEALAELLNEARDRGVKAAPQIAQLMGPALGWPVELATQYLTQNLSYKLTPRLQGGMRRFLALAAAEGIVPDVTELVG